MPDQPTVRPTEGDLLPQVSRPRFAKPHRDQHSRPGRGVLLATLALCTAVWIASCGGGGEHSGKVLNVLEGDLLKVEMNGRWVRVQLAGVDSPVRGQPYRDEARAFTVQLVQGKDITVRVVDTGDAGHVVGEVLLAGGKTLNRDLVAAGLAWHRSSWFARHPDLRAAQEQARAARRGLWRDSNPVPPWEFLGDKSWRDRKEM